MPLWAFISVVTGCLLLPGQTVPGEFIIEGHEWAYFKGTEEPPPDWNTVGFDDAAWPRGVTPFGYGDITRGTILPDMEDGYISLYIRCKFSVLDIAALHALNLRMSYDDGYVAYINGVEVDRGSMGSETPRYDTPGLPHETNEVFEPSTLCVSTLPLVKGENVLAIQGHNYRQGDDDFTLSAELVDEPSMLCPTDLDCIMIPAGRPVQVLLRWRKPHPFFVFDSLALFRDGVPMSTIAPYATSFTDRRVSQGEHTYELRTTACGIECPTPPSCTVTLQPPSFRRADANDSDSVDIADAVWILRLIFQGSEESSCFDVTDVDDNGSVDVSDPVYLLNYQFSGGPAPAPPFGSCGQDVMEDDLTCLPGRCDGSP